MSPYSNYCRYYVVNCVDNNKQAQSFICFVQNKEVIKWVRSTLRNAINTLYSRSTNQNSTNKDPTESLKVKHSQSESSLKSTYLILQMFDRGCTIGIWSNRVPQSSDGRQKLWKTWLVSEGKASMRHFRHEFDGNGDVYVRPTPECVFISWPDVWVSVSGCWMGCMETGSCEVTFETSFQIIFELKFGLCCEIFKERCRCIVPLFWKYKNNTDVTLDLDPEDNPFHACQEGRLRKQ